MRFSSLGDLVLTGPVYRSLKARWPNGRISVLTKPAFAELLAGHPAVDEVLVFKGLLPTIREVRRRRFSHVLDLHANLRSLLISFFSGAPNKARYHKNALARRVFVLSRHRMAGLERHTLDRYLESLKAWDVPAADRGLQLQDWRRKAPASAAGFHRIAVIQTAFIGDATLTLPLIEAARAAFPQARFTVVARPAAAPIFRSAGVEEVIEDPKRGAFHLLPLWRTARRLRGHDLALLPHRSLRAALLARLAGIPRRVGFEQSPGSSLLTDRVAFSWLLHGAERSLSLLSPLIGKVTPQDRSPLSPVRGKSLLEGLRRPLVGLHPGSVWPTKRWLPERFAQVARELAKDPGATCVLLGVGSDKELADQIEKASDGACVNLVGRTELAELMGVLSELQLFITNDSGPMHLATSLKVPTLALFGPTTRELGFFPYGPGHRVLEAEGLPCRPCGLHGTASCPEGHFLCMRLITADQTLRAARKMLESRRAPFDGAAQGSAA